MNQFLKFQSIFQYRIWGGEKLKTILNKDYTETKIGESWEISGVKGFESKLLTPIQGCENLEDLIKIFPNEVLGKRVYEKYGSEFPLLIKFIDSKEPLSVQVHPNDDFAKEHHNSFGKTEMWYIMEADENAEIISGFTRELDQTQYRAILQSNEIESVIKTWKVKKGDTIFLPAGRIHAIGAGVLLAEIQQTSDVTYRIYDYNRIDKDGKTRELHNDIAEKVIDYSDTENPIITKNETEEVTETLVKSPYFTTNLLNINNSVSKNYEDLDSFVVLICVEGHITLKSETESTELSYGETVLIPASLKGELQIESSSNSKVLEVFIP